MFEVTRSSGELAGGLIPTAASIAWAVRRREGRGRADPRSVSDRRLAQGPTPGSLQRRDRRRRKMVAQRRGAGHVPDGDHRALRVPRRHRVLDEPDRGILEAPVSGWAGRTPARSTPRPVGFGASRAPKRSTSTSVRPPASAARTAAKSSCISASSSSLSRGPSHQAYRNPLSAWRWVFSSDERADRGVEGVEVVDGEAPDPPQEDGPRPGIEKAAPGRSSDPAPAAIAGSPRGRQSRRARVGRCRQVPPAAGPPATSSIAWAWPRAPSNGSRTSRWCPMAASPSRIPGPKRGSICTTSGGAKWAAGTGDQRGAATAVATSTPPSTRAETTWAKIAGWASPPMLPCTTQGRPSRKSIPGSSVCRVRLRGRQHVRVVGVQAEVAAPVLVGDPGRRVHDAASEAGVVGLDQADRVALADPRPRARSCRLPVARAMAGGAEARAGSIPRARDSPYAGVEESRDRHVDERGIGQVGVAIREGPLRCLDPEVGPAQVGTGGRTALARDEGGSLGWLERRQDAEDLEGDQARAVGRVRGGRRPAVRRSRAAPPRLTRGRPGRPP